MNRLLTISLLALGLSGCAASGPQLKTEHSYRVEWIGERPLIDRSYLSITLADDGRAYGNAGCNHWFSNYRLDGEKLSIGTPGSTRKMCAPALMEQETRFLESLSQVQRWDFSPTGQLQLWPAEGKPLRLWSEDK